jgi:hypothetical protein
VPPNVAVERPRHETTGVALYRSRSAPTFCQVAPLRAGVNWIERQIRFRKAREKRSV